MAKLIDEYLQSIHPS